MLRSLLLLVALVSTSGLRVFVGSSRGAAARACAARMALPKIEDARSLSTASPRTVVALGGNALVPSNTLRAEAPDLLLDFYESRLQFS